MHLSARNLFVFASSVLNQRALDHALALTGLDSEDRNCLRASEAGGSESKYSLTASVSARSLGSSMGRSGAPASSSCLNVVNMDAVLATQEAQTSSALLLASFSSCSVRAFLLGLACMMSVCRAFPSAQEEKNPIYFCLFDLF